jgi:hypothetical protein
MHTIRKPLAVPGNPHASPLRPRPPHAPKPPPIVYRLYDFTGSLAPRLGPQPSRQSASRPIDFRPSSAMLRSSRGDETMRKLKHSRPSRRHGPSVHAARRNVRCDDLLHGYSAFHIATSADSARRGRLPWTTPGLPGLLAMTAGRLATVLLVLAQFCDGVEASSAFQTLILPSLNLLCHG